MKCKIFLLFFIPMICSCGGNENIYKDRIVFSLGSMEYFYKRIFENRNDSAAIIKDAVNVHAYTPSAKILNSLAGAKYFVALGTEKFEINIKKWLSLKNKNVKVIFLSDFCELKNFEEVGLFEDEKEISHEHEYLSYDPHFYLSYKNFKKIANTIYEEFKNKDDDISFYNNFLTEIENEENDMKELFANKKDLTVLIYHPILGYLGDELGFKQISLEMYSQKPSMKHLEDFVNFAINHNVKTIFLNKGFSDSFKDFIKSKTNVKIEYINPMTLDILSNMRNILEEVAKSG